MFPPSLTPRKEGLLSSGSAKDLESFSISRSQLVTANKDLDMKEGKEQDAASIETHRSEPAPREDSNRPR